MEDIYKELRSFGFKTEATDALEVLDPFREHLEKMYEGFLTPSYIEGDKRIQAASELLEFGDFHEVLEAGRILARVVQEENEFWERAELEEMNSY